MPQFVSISKLDAAKRQLETAITLFFTQSDPVSIHTLVAASHEVFDSLLQRQDMGKSFLDESISKFIRPEMRVEVKRKIKEAQNFFKHANNDPDEVHRFHFKLTDLFLWDPCMMYQKLTGEKTVLISVFILWFYSEYPDSLLDRYTKTRFCDFKKELNLEGKDRESFLELLPDLIKLRNKDKL